MNKKIKSKEIGSAYPYRVDSRARVFKIGKNGERQLKPSRTWNGYDILFMRPDGEWKTYGVHTLLANAFIDNPENKEYVIHKNGKTWDNRLKNLQWATPVEFRASIEKRQKHTHRIDEVIVKKIQSLYKKEGMTQKEIAKVFKITQASVSHVLNGLKQFA